MSQTDIDQLKFPSGRPVGSARKDAKKLSKEENIPLHDAQNRIARENAEGMDWDKAIASLKASSSAQGREATWLLLKSFFTKTLSMIDSQRARGNTIFADGASTIGRLYNSHIDALCSVAKRNNMNSVLPLITVDGAELLIQQEDLPIEFKQRLKSLVSAPTTPLFMGYLTNTLKIAAAKVTFLALRFGAGKTTILHLLLAESLHCRGHAVLITRSRSLEKVLQELPMELKNHYSLAEVDWDKNGMPVDLKLPTKPNKLIVIHISALWNFNQMPSQTERLIVGLSRLALFSDMHTICIDELRFGLIPQEEERAFNSVLEHFQPFGERQLVIATDPSESMDDFGKKASVPFRVIKAVHTFDHSQSDLKGASTGLAADSSTVTIVTEGELSEDLFESQIDFIEDAARLTLIRRERPLNRNNLFKRTHKNLMSFIEQARGNCS
jgi:hypothetical protein